METLETETQGQINIAPPTSEWDFTASRDYIDDPLLHALMVLTKLYDKPFSAEALTAGLPLDRDAKLTPELFIRAAQRASLSAKVVKKSLDLFKPNHLPAVLLLKDHRACILTEIKDGQATVIFPETGAGAETFSLSFCQQLYQGFCILTHPLYQFTKRTEGIQPAEQKHWFWSVVRKGWPTLSEVLMASLLINLFALATPLFIMNVYDRVVPNHAVETLWALAIGVLVVFSFDFIMRNVRTYFIDSAGKKIDVELSANVFEQIMGLKMEKRPQSVGVLANTVQSFDSFREFLTSATISVMVDLPFAFLFIALIWFIGGPLAYVPLISIPIVVIASLIMQMPVNRLINKAYQYQAEKQATLFEALSNVETIKTNNAESPLQRRWESLTQDAAKITIKLRLLSGGTLSFAQFVHHATTVILIIYGVYLINAHELTLGGLIACTILTGRALAPMSQIAGLITRFHQSTASLKALDKIMTSDVDRTAGLTPIHRDRFQGHIEFRKVTFHYPNQTISALQDVSFKIKPREKVGLVGRIGSGKTTLEKCLVGLYHPTSGNILIDGIETNQVDPADLRAHIGYIPQDIELFYGSIKENITLGAPYVDDAQILQAAQISGVDQFVDTHPDGYERQVGERGKLLSGGQRQAIVIARTLLLDPPVIIMDEPTNLMDDKTERGLRTRFEQFLKNKTLILITHRASMLNLVDRLIVVDQGQLVADGSKDYVLDALSKGRVHTSVM